MTSSDNIVIEEDEYFQTVIIGKNAVAIQLINIRNNLVNRPSNFSIDLLVFPIDLLEFLIDLPVFSIVI